MEIARIANLTDLTELLKKHGLNPHSFGQGISKPLTSLLNEIHSGEACLIIESGKLIRQIRLLLIGVIYDGGYRQFRLKEDKQVFNDGRVRHLFYDEMLQSFYYQNMSE